MTAPAIPPVVEISTPRWLTGSVALVWALALVFVVASIIAVRAQRNALDTIANNSAKSVIAAQRIKVGFADMDANAANTLLSPQQKQKSIDAYNNGREAMTNALVDAAHNITFDGEEKVIKALAKDSSIYSARVEAAFTMQYTGASAAVPHYLKAAELMDEKLIPAAREIDTINRGELDKSYSSIQRISVIQTILVWMTGLALIAILLRVQFFIGDRMRRTLNPPCLLATFLAAGLLLYTNHALSAATHQIEVVKADAFESLHSLWQAKALAYEANAQESRYLLDKPGAARHKARFAEIASLMANDPMRLVALTNGTNGKLPVELKGLLVEELRNITFTGERDAAVGAARWWAQYVEIDRKIQVHEAEGQHDKALALCLGEGEGQSNRAFNEVIRNIDKTLEINQQAFEEASRLGFNALSRFEVIAPVIALIAALLCLFGVLPRIREYSA